MKVKKIILTFYIILALCFIPINSAVFAADICIPIDSINISGQKIWNDKGYENLRPDKVNIFLYADGKKVEGKPLTLSSDKQWKGTFRNLPRYDKGVEIKYTVVEEVLENYEINYVQPVAESVSIGSWGEKITPASQSTYTLNGDIVVAKKGGQYFIWTLSALTDVQKNKTITAVNAAKLQGLGKELAARNTTFTNGLPTTFERGNININAFGGKTQINFKKTNTWSLFYNGQLTITDATGWIVTNAYTAPAPTPEPDEPEPPVPPEPDQPDPQPSPESELVVVHEHDVDMDTPKVVAPATGDYSNIEVWLTVLFTALLVAGAVGIVRKVKK